MINLFEWQLSEYEYPTLIKDIGYELYEETKTSSQLKHCVLSVAKQYDGDTSKAFAICIAHLQKYGYLKKGTKESTKKGKSASKSKAAQKGHLDKVGAYETLLKINRKNK